jgi:hypothetical protein
MALRAVLRTAFQQPGIHAATEGGQRDYTLVFFPLILVYPSFSSLAP